MGIAVFWSTRPFSKQFCLFIWYLEQIFFFFFPFYAHTHGIWKFLGRVSNWSCSCGLYHSYGNTGSEPHLWPTYITACGNAGSLTHWATTETPRTNLLYKHFFYISISVPYSRIKYSRSSHCGSAVINLTSIHKDADLISGLAQWVKDLVLSWAVV